MEQVIIELLTIQNQFRIYHWQTKSYARHNAFGTVYGDLDGLIDEFVEICMGKHGRPDFQGKVSLILSDLKELDPTHFCDTVIEFLIDLKLIILCSCGTCLFNKVHLFLNLLTNQFTNVALCIIT